MASAFCNGKCYCKEFVSYNSEAAEIVLNVHRCIVLRGVGMHCRPQLPAVMAINLKASALGTGVSVIRGKKLGLGERR